MNRKVFCICIMMTIILAGCATKENATQTDDSIEKPVIMPQIEYDTFAYDNIRIDVLVYDDTKEINVRKLPSKDSMIVGKVLAGEEYYVSEYYLTKDGNWYGFVPNQIGVDDVAGIVWINEYYIGLHHWEFAEEYEVNASEIKIWYDNGHYTIKVVEDTNLRCVAGYNNDHAIYGLLPAGSVIETDVVYKNGNDRFLGFPVENFNCTFKGEVFGHVSRDQDGIVWLAIENAEVYDY